jgi:hypothetical protein
MDGFKWLLVLMALIYPSATFIYYGNGVVAYYEDPLGMKNVVEVRNGWGQDLDLSGYIDGIALNDCSLIGRAVMLRRGDGPLIGPFLCVDCAQEQHLAWREEKNIIADVGWLTAKVLWGADTYIPDVTIYIVGEKYGVGRTAQKAAKRLR